jgi:predicted Co/Zn/Cd cation transporter (cation efflux family)
MVGSCNTGVVMMEGVACRSHGRPVLIGGVGRPWLLDSRMSLIFDGVYGHMKLCMPLLDCQRRLLSRFIRVVPRFQLPIDRYVERFRQGRFAGSSYRGSFCIGGN